MVTSIVIVGIGGQGVVKASDILAEAAFHAAFEVKKSDVHGMSQRGGSVTSDVRYGDTVFSPMVPRGEADYLLVSDAEEVERALPLLRENGVRIMPDDIPEVAFSDDTNAQRQLAQRTANVALLGVLSAYLDIDVKFWHEAIEAILPEKVHAVNRQAFDAGRKSKRRRFD